MGHWPDSTGTTLEIEWVNVIQRNRALFASGSVLFFPTPTTAYVNSVNVGQVMPHMNEPKALVDKVPITQENSGLLATTSAEAFDAIHCVDSSFAALSTVGRLVTDVKLPLIHGVSADDLALILADNQDSVQAFRSRVRSVTEDLLTSGADLYSPLVIRNISREIEDGANQLGSEFSQLRQSNALQALGAAVLTGLATLSVTAIPTIPITLLTVLGTGGLGAVGFQYLAYLQQLRQKSKSPYYFYWKLAKLNDA